MGGVVQLYYRVEKWMGKGVQVGGVISVRAKFYHRIFQLRSELLKRESIELSYYHPFIIQ